MIRKFLCLAVIAALPAQAAGWRDTVTAFADANLKHPAWGESHSRRDYALARAMAAEDHVTLDDDILFAASYLHDMAAFPQWREAGRDHSDAAADKVDTILAGTDFPVAKMEGVRAAIRTHMFYRDAAAPEAREPKNTPEALYLHDADALDWLGAIGVARIFGLVDPGGGKPTGPDAVKMIQDYVAKVPPRVVTPAGKARLLALLAQDQAFLDALARESRNFGDL
jgi:hypothetical protein